MESRTSAERSDVDVRAACLAAPVVLMASLPADVLLRRLLLLPGKFATSIQDAVLPGMGCGLPASFVRFGCVMNASTNKVPGDSNTFSASAI